MDALTRWRPMRELETIRQRMDDMFGRIPATGESAEMLRSRHERWHAQDSGQNGAEVSEVQG